MVSNPEGEKHSTFKMLQSSTITKKNADSGHCHVVDPGCLPDKVLLQLSVQIVSLHLRFLRNSPPRTGSPVFPVFVMFRFTPPGDFFCSRHFP